MVMSQTVYSKSVNQKLDLPKQVPRNEFNLISPGRNSPKYESLNSLQYLKVEF